MRHVIQFACCILILALARGASAQDNAMPSITQPGRAENGIVLLDKTMLGLNPLTGRLNVQVLFDPQQNAAPVVRKGAEGAGLAYLRRLAVQKNVAGLADILYDNRDRDHSSLPYNNFPQLTRTRYSNDLKKNRLDYGLGNRITFSAITFGNSSTAYGGLRGRSLTREAMTRQGGPDRAYQNYVSDQIYVYPEHKDHDDTDLFPANWPYTFTSQGSSYSDRGILNAIAMILAALPQETRNRMDQLNLVAPTVQMIFRRAQSNVRSRAAYLSGLAHPTVFPKTALAPERMMALAASLTPDTIPPMVRLRVIEESFTDAAGLAERSEKLFDTPSAIARVWRAEQGRQVMHVSAKGTRDPNNHLLTYEWVLLRGDPTRVRIDPDGDSARITLDWHAPYPINRNPQRTTSRVDIAVFANNGTHDSAPAFISIDFPAHQSRLYEVGSDGTPRPVQIDYDAVSKGKYFDPALYWSAPWKDSFTYDRIGKVVGWIRYKNGAPDEHFRADGTRANGLPFAYEVTQEAGKPPILRIVGGS